jgi:hypothetical protein
MYNVSGQSRQLLGGADIEKLRNRGILKDEEYAYIEGNVIMAENPKTQDKRVVGKVSELLVEHGTKRVLNG